jgi:hypothetical protein
MSFEVKILHLCKKDEIILKLVIFVLSAVKPKKIN